MNETPQTTIPSAKPQRRESIFSKRNLIAIAVGTLLYAVLTIPSNMLDLPGAYLGVLRPTVAIPMAFGFIFGPIAGFVSGSLGNAISDQVSFSSFYWNWDIGNGLLGLIPSLGYYTVKKSEWVKAIGLGMLAILSIIGSIIGIGFAVLTDYVFQLGIATWSEGMADFVPKTVMDAVCGAILAPVIVLIYIKIRKNIVLE